MTEACSGISSPPYYETKQGVIDEIRKITDDIATRLESLQALKAEDDLLSQLGQRDFLSEDTDRIQDNVRFLNLLISRCLKLSDEKEIKKQTRKNILNLVTDCNKLSIALIDLFEKA